MQCAPNFIKIANTNPFLGEIEAKIDPIRKFKIIVKVQTFRYPKPLFVKLELMVLSHQKV